MGHGLDPGYLQSFGLTLNRVPTTIFQDKLLTMTYYDEAGEYAVPNVLSPDLSVINCTSSSTQLCAGTIAFIFMLL